MPRVFDTSVTPRVPYQEGPAKSAMPKSACNSKRFVPRQWPKEWLHLGCQITCVTSIQLQTSERDRLPERMSEDMPDGAPDQTQAPHQSVRRRTSTGGKEAEENFPFAVCLARKIIDAMAGINRKVIVCHCFIACLQDCKIAAGPFVPPHFSMAAVGSKFFHPWWRCPKNLHAALIMSLRSTLWKMGPHAKMAKPLLRGIVFDLDGTLTAACLLCVLGHWGWVASCSEACSITNLPTCTHVMYHPRCRIWISVWCTSVAVCQLAKICCRLLQACKAPTGIARKKSSRPSLHG